MFRLYDNQMTLIKHSEITLSCFYKFQRALNEQQIFGVIRFISSQHNRYKRHNSHILKIAPTGVNVIVSGRFSIIFSLKVSLERKIQ